MNSGSITTRDGKIAWRQSAGTGPAIVLVHGNSASSQAFTRQLDGSLGQKYRVIAFDLPGHGESDNAADPAKTYNMRGYAGVLRAVVTHFDAGDAVFAGWSLGGHIVLEAAPDLPDAKGFVIFGTPPLGLPPAMDKAFLPHPAMAFTFAAEMNEEQASAYAAASFRPGATDIPQDMIAGVLRTDGRARVQLLAPALRRDQIEVAANLTQPLAVLHGAQEQLINGDYFKTLTMPTLWRGAVQVITGAGHIPQWEQPDKFNALLEALSPIAYDIVLRKVEARRGDYRNHLRRPRLIGQPGGYSPFSHKRLVQIRTLRILDSVTDGPHYRTLFHR